LNANGREKRNNGLNSGNLGGIIASEAKTYGFRQADLPKKNFLPELKGNCKIFDFFSGPDATDMFSPNCPGLERPG